MKIQYVVKTGKNAGLTYEPHLHKNGKYVVSKTRFESDYIYVDNFDEIIQHLDLGYKVRVSCPIIKNSPSLVIKKSLEITKM